MSPIIKAEIPEAIPASMVSARAGLTAMSFNMVPPAGTDLYNKVVNDMPMKNNAGIATASPSDHQPSLIFGRILILTFITSFAALRIFYSLCFEICYILHPVKIAPNKMVGFSNKTYATKLLTFSWFSYIISRKSNKNKLKHYSAKESLVLQ